ncbi:TRAP transporter small permease subunit [Castellaniella sp. GW247-6E4]|uniref:TRAP transporter small permease subunit n=1 Tax=Castellaniella sp. GW247-6E4 TaxID=3140380 RepID=UPI00331645B9
MRASHALVLVCSTALVLMMIQVTLDVAGKYLLHEPIPGNETIVASYYMVAIVFLPLAWVEVCGEAIVVELLYGIASKPIRMLMAAMGAAATVICYGFLAWFLWAPAMHAYRIGEFDASTWDVITWPSRFLLPIGLALGALVALLQLTRILTGQGPLKHEFADGTSDFPDQI